MNRPARALRWLLCAALLASAGCQSPLGPGGPLPRESSLLAVDVRFPVPLGRDPVLVGIFLAKGPVHAGLSEIPELVAASFIVGSRAYLIDPEPGTYSLVAVSSYFAPERGSHPLGVRNAVWNRRDTGQLTAFPEELIQRTRTTVGPGFVAFMGALDVPVAERVSADTRFQDLLQQRVVEAIRPEDAGASGLRARFTTTWLPDLDASSVSRQSADRDAFRAAAREDLGGSAWAGLIPAPTGAVAGVRHREAPTPEVPRRAAPSQERVERAAPVPPPPSAATPSPPPPSSGAGASTAATAPPAPPVAPLPAAEEQIAIPTAPPAPPTTLRDLDPEPLQAPLPEPSRAPLRKPSPPLPDASPLARILIGMSDDEVRSAVGDPDERSTYRTSRAFIPFYTGSDSHQVDWVYEGEGRVVFSMDDRRGLLEVLDVVYDPKP